MAGFEYYVQKIDELSPVKDRFTVVTMLNLSVTIVPAICALITLVLYLFYDLDDAAHAKIREELAERRKV